MIQERAWDGKQITQPGIYSRMPLSTYHRADICDGISLSSSSLRRIFNESPADYWDTSPLNPDRAEENDNKEAFVLGRAVHHLTLGEPFFTKLFTERPDEIEDRGKMEPWNGNRNACKRWLERAAAKGLTPLTKTQMGKIRGMMLSLSRQPVMRQGILNGKIERSMFWRDPESGIWLKARPDAIPKDSGDFTDLKTTTGRVHYYDLQRVVEDYGYYQQAALTGEGFRVLTGQQMSAFAFMFVQSRRPYSCRLHQLKEHDLKLGEQANRYAINVFQKCWAAKSWPGPGGYQEDASWIELSKFARERIEDRLKYGI